MSGYQSDVWVLTAEWWDGDSLRHGHTFFSTKRDAAATGSLLRLRHNGPEGTEFTYTVEKAVPWRSTARSVPFTDDLTIATIVAATEKEWDL